MASPFTWSLKPEIFRPPSSFHHSSQSNMGALQYQPPNLSPTGPSSPYRLLPLLPSSEELQLVSNQFLSVCNPDPSSIPLPRGAGATFTMLQAPCVDHHLILTATLGGWFSFSFPHGEAKAQSCCVVVRNADSNQGSQCHLPQNANPRLAQAFNASTLPIR